jgi:pimeloyl-ACP methyl ester carboxylesterase
MNEPWGCEHRVIETNGIHLHCAVAGKGPLVLLLHGFPECWYSWRHQISALAPHFQVVAPDLRGYGESDKPEGVSNYTIPLLTDDVRGLLDAFGAEQAVIVGHDWGGALAWAFASRYPRETARLIVLNCPHPALFARHLSTNPGQILRSWYMFFFQIPWVPEQVLTVRDHWAVEQIFRASAARPDAFRDEDVERYKRAAAQPGALTAAINYYRAAFRGPQFLALLPASLRQVAERLSGPIPEPVPAAKIGAPTLVIWGEDDSFLCKELTNDMESLFTSRFEIKYIPHRGHWIQQEEPDLVNQYLLEFLADMCGVEGPHVGPLGTEILGSVPS